MTNGLKSILINQEIFNVGNEANCMSVQNIYKNVNKILKFKSKIIWYGSKDKRSYRVSFNKSRKLGFKVKYNLDYGINEIKSKYEKNKINFSSKNYTLKWYKELEYFNDILKDITLKNKILKR